ncbi:MAG: hypothetical protein RL220_1802, partial [Bacteroidota bacterium]
MDLGVFTIDDEAMTLQFAGANLNLYILREGEWICLKGTRRPLGVEDHQAIPPFANEVFQLKKGDCVYAWTDGLPDQFGGLNNKKFKTTGVLSFIRSLPAVSMSRQKELISAHIRSWRGSAEQTDDICVAGFRI